MTLICKDDCHKPLTLSVLPRRRICAAVGLGVLAVWTPSLASACENTVPRSLDSVGSCIRQFAGTIESSITLPPAVKALGLVRLADLSAQMMKAEAQMSGNVRTQSSAMDPESLVNKALSYLPSVKDAVSFASMAPEYDQFEVVQNDLSRWSIRFDAIRVLQDVRSNKAVEIFNAALRDMPFTDPGCTGKLIPDVELTHGYISDFATDVRDVSKRAQFLASQLDLFKSSLAIPAASHAVLDFGSKQSGSNLVIESYIRFISQAELFPVVFDNRGSIWASNLRAVFVEFKDHPSAPKLGAAIRTFFEARSRAGHCPRYADSYVRQLVTKNLELLSSGYGLSIQSNDGRRLDVPATTMAEPETNAVEAFKYGVASDISQLGEFVSLNVPGARLSALVAQDEQTESVLAQPNVQAKIPSLKEVKSILPVLRQKMTAARQPDDLAFLIMLTSQESRAIEWDRSSTEDQMQFISQLMESNAIWVNSPNLLIRTIDDTAFNFKDALDGKSARLFDRLTKSQSEIVRIFSWIRAAKPVVDEATIPQNSDGSTIPQDNTATELEDGQ